MSSDSRRHTKQLLSSIHAYTKGRHRGLGMGRSIRCTRVLPLFVQHATTRISRSRDTQRYSFYIAGRGGVGNAGESRRLLPCYILLTHVPYTEYSDVDRGTTGVRQQRPRAREVVHDWVVWCASSCSVCVVVRSHCCPESTWSWVTISSHHPSSQFTQFAKGMLQPSHSLNFRYQRRDNFLVDAPISLYMTKKSRKTCNRVSCEVAERRCVRGYHSSVPKGYG
jgi:hypothetical protein